MEQHFPDVIIDPACLLRNNWNQQAAIISKKRLWIKQIRRRHP